MGAYNGNTGFVMKGAKAKIGLRDVFSDVFKKHNARDGEKLFMSGLSTTTPASQNMLREWKKPWLFIWVLGACLLILLMSIWLSFNLAATAGLGLISFVGTAMMPVAFIIFAFELNIPRNVPLYWVLFMFMAGGVASLVVTTLLLNYVTSSGNALVTALREEFAKLVIVTLFMAFPRGKNKYPYILSGILVGCVVGNGFSAFESAKYFFDNSLDFSVLFLRAILSPGGHGLWAALYGGALAMVANGQPLRPKYFIDKRFLLFLAAGIGLHTLWDCVGYIGWFAIILSFVCGWAVFLVMINKGVKQIVDIDHAYSDLPTAVNQPLPKAAVYLICCVTGDLAGRIYPLTGETLTIGRDPSACNIVFPASANTISRKHCVLTLEGTDVMLIDKGSTHGTLLENGERLTPGVPKILKAGARFSLASRAVTFEVRVK